MAKRQSNNTVERAGAPAKLSLPDVYKRPQRSKGATNVGSGSVQGTASQNQNVRRNQDLEKVGVNPARKGVQKSQVWIQQKFHNLNLRTEPTQVAAAEKGGAVSAYTN